MNIIGRFLRWLSGEQRIYGVAERNEHGAIVVRPRQQGLLPGTVVEIIPLDEAAIADPSPRYTITPKGKEMIAA